MKTAVFKILAMSATLLVLPGCLDLAVSGAQATYNRYNISNSVRDHYITMKVDRQIHWYTQDYKDSNVTVNTFNCVVVITGQVQTKALHDRLTEIAKKVPDVDRVYNLTTIMNSPSALSIVSDDWITTKIKAKFLAEIDIDPSAIKVITENGVVYLMGTVFPDQADIAVEIARNTDGVQSVIKIFSYLKITRKPGA